MSKPPKIVAALAVMFALNGLGLIGCEDYPVHEPSATQTDNQMGGPGLYGGTCSPAGNGTTATTQETATTR